MSYLRVPKNNIPENDSHIQSSYLQNYLVSLEKIKNVIRAHSSYYLISNYCFLVKLEVARTLIERFDIRA